MTVPKHGSDRVGRIVHGILSCYDRLSRFESLEPTSELNDVFEELVGLCSRILDADTVAEVSQVVRSHEEVCFVSPPSQILHHSRIVRITPHLRQLCSQGEFRLEACWARKIVDCPTSEKGVWGETFCDRKSELT